MSEKQEITAVEHQQGKRSSLGKVGLLLTILALIAFAGIFTYGYLQLSQVNISLARTVTDLKTEVNDNRRELAVLRQSVSGVEKTEQQSSQQGQNIASWIATQQGDMTRWQAAEAQYLTRLASYQLDLTKDANAANILLQHAQQLLQNISNPALDPIRQALASNVASLQAQPQANIEQIYSQLTSVYNQIDQLPLPETPLQFTEDANAKPRDYSGMPWWKGQWHRTMDTLRKVVIVRYNGGNDMPLVLPEEKMFLYQNLHAQLQAAMLSALERNAVVYQTSLSHVSGWIQKYFVQDAPLTKSVLGEVQALQSVNMSPPAVNLAATLQLFDQFLAQNNTTPPAQPAVKQE